MKIKDLKAFLTDSFLKENSDLFEENLSAFDTEVIQGVEVQVKYQGYISRQKEIIKSLQKMENLKLYGLGLQQSQRAFFGRQGKTGRSEASKPWTGQPDQRG